MALRYLVLALALLCADGFRPLPRKAAVAPRMLGRHGFALRAAPDAGDAAPGEEQGRGGDGGDGEAEGGKPGQGDAAVDWDAAWKNFSSDAPREEAAAAADGSGGDAPGPTAPPPTEGGAPKMKFPPPPPPSARAPPKKRRSTANPPPPPYSRRGAGRKSFEDVRRAEGLNVPGVFGLPGQDGGAAPGRPAPRGSNPEFRVVDLFSSGQIFVFGGAIVGLLFFFAVSVFFSGQITNSADRFPGLDGGGNVPTIQEDMVV